MRLCFWLLALSLLALPVGAQVKKSAAKPLYEAWQAGYYEGVKVGHTHTVAIETESNGTKVIQTTKTLDLVLKRYGSIVPIKAVQSSEETPDGKVISLGLSYFLSKDEEVKSKGVVRGKQMIFTTSLAPDDSRRLPFPPECAGYYFQESVFARKKVKPGESIEVPTYEMLLQTAVPLVATVKEMESVDKLIGKLSGKELKIIREPARLLRVEVVPKKIIVGDKGIQLPTKIVWLDEKLMPAREQFEVPGQGMVTMYTTTREAALKEGVAPHLLPDLGLNISIRLAQTIENPYRTTEAVYRVTTTEPLEDIFVEDARQKVSETKKNQFDLTVKAIREPGKKSDEMPGKEYLDSNQFIDSNNAQVRALAKQAVGTETDPWKKAQKIEKWVHDKMKVSTSTGFPTAAQIAKDLEGDCRQHALLTAAMCRAAGVPSRTAVGLIYVREDGRSPTFGFHMWTEVWVGGRWLGLDAILGEGGIGATHLKMGEHSWAKTVTLAPLLPISRTLGKLKIEVVRAK